jgi:dihydroorotate dehydrogenase electron transfer subunit
MTATEDGTLGVKGRVTALLEAEIAALKGRPAVVYTCGPWRMMEAVSRLAQGAGLACFASLERVMGCGYGVCNGCVARVVSEGPTAFRYAKTCVEGTVMDASTLLW